MCFAAGISVPQAISAILPAAIPTLDWHRIHVFMKARWQLPFRAFADLRMYP
jgi:hypothetical protein